MASSMGSLSFQTVAREGLNYLMSVAKPRRVLTIHCKLFDASFDTDYNKMEEIVLERDTPNGRRFRLTIDQLEDIITKYFDDNFAYQGVKAEHQHPEEKTMRVNPDISYCPECGWNLYERLFYENGKWIIWSWCSFCGGYCSRERLV